MEEFRERKIIDIKRNDEKRPFPSPLITPFRLRLWIDTTILTRIKSKEKFRYQLVYIIENSRLNFHLIFLLILGRVWNIQNVKLNA